MVAETNDEGFRSDVIESPLPAIVDFWAPWCGPCRIVNPIIERLSETMAGRAKIFKVNVDENPECANTYRIAGIPTVIFFNKGEVAQELIGIQPEQVYINTLEEIDRAA
jgi:thioredoxin 1